MLYKLFSLGFKILIKISLFNYTCKRIIRRVFWFLISLYIKILLLVIRILLLIPKSLKWGIYLTYVILWVIFGPDFAWYPKVILFHLQDWPCLVFLDIQRREYRKRYFSFVPKDYCYHTIIWWKFHGDQMFTLTFNVLKDEIKYRGLSEYFGLELQIFQNAILGLVNFFILLKYYDTRWASFDIFLDSKFIVFFLLKCDFKYIYEIGELYKKLRIDALFWNDWNRRYNSLYFFEFEMRRILFETIFSNYSRIELNDFNCIHSLYIFPLLRSYVRSYSDAFLERKVLLF